MFSPEKPLGLFRKRQAGMLASSSASVQSGLPPGTPVFIGEHRTEDIGFKVMAYSETECEEKDIDNLDDLLAYRDRPEIAWINVNGVHDVDVIARLGAHFGLHPLVQEDIVNTSQRPKLEDYGAHIYLVIRMIRYDSETNQLASEQVSMLLGSSYVLTIQEREGDVFDPIRERIRNAKGRIRTLGVDYVFYALLDAIIDSYFGVLESIGERVEVVEQDVMTNPSPGTLSDIHNLRTQVLFLRKSVWPLREAVSSLEKTDSGLVKAETKVFLRDAYDHTIQLIDTVETFRDVASSLFETHLSIVSNRMNEVMKVLTIIATIFIPITFVAGVYGMNFEHMPELAHPYAYPAVWALMIGIAVAMLVYFRRKGWL